jgi:hypothetical protein
MLFPKDNVLAFRLRWPIETMGVTVLQEGKMV